MIDTAVVHSDESLKLVTARNLLVVVWSDAPTLPQMQALARAAMALRRAHPRGTAMLNVIRSGTPSFDQAVREEARRLTSGSHFAVAAAHLVLVGGLAGAAVRAFLSTIALLGRPKEPTQVFATHDAALSWLADQLATGAAPWTRQEVQAAYDQAMAS